MGATPVPPASALDTLITTTLDPSSPHAPHLHALAHQIKHNLQHQHLWTDLQIHTHTHTSSSTSSSTPLPRPLISGLPPSRLYIHPDEQLSLLQAQKARGGVGLGEVESEREWVLPSHIHEKWTLRRFGEVFDRIEVVPPGDAKAGAQEEDRHGDGEGEDEDERNPWRKTKRVVLATLDDDSTVVYYIVHDGIVKPRQN
ncbi:hypothetical protein MBLNU457_3458t1 [Dothideomycetes sp. NU457]